MSSNETHERSTTDADEMLKQTRLQEAEMERKFPGYPPYLSEITLQKIEWDVERHAKRLHEMLTEMFGYFAVQDLSPEKLQPWVRTLAQNVAHQAAGHMAAKGVLDAQRSSHNTMMAALAGIALGSRADTETDERGTTDAGTES